MRNDIRRLPVAMAVLVTLLAPRFCLAGEDAGAKRPNVIFILADDLGNGDLGCFGQQRIKTPHLDKLAAEGTRFTSAYCGTSVCAPSRCSLMTGLHMGHAPIRANREQQPEGQFPLASEYYTVAELFRDHGYATACIGKWGLGMFGTSGDPLQQGFDHFFGYNCQRHAHSYFPTYLYRDAERFDLNGKTYAQDLISDDALAWVRKHKAKPFFLYYALTLPHGKYEIDSLGEYANQDWPREQKIYAAMVSRMDADIGKLLALLEDLNLTENTLVIFASDHGASEIAQDQPKLFNSNGGLRGIKRSMYEGGLRTPAIARWPGQTPAGKVNDQPWAFWDFLPTCADLLGASLPPGTATDGVSIVPLLRGEGAVERSHFYWELHEKNVTNQAVRFGNWKAVRNSPSTSIELYDLSTDLAEQHDLAGDRPDMIKRAEMLLLSSRESSPDWPMKDRPQNAKRKKVKVNGRKATPN